MRKKNKNLTIACIILSLIIVFLLGYIITLETNNTQNLNVGTNVTQNKNSEEKTLDLKKAELLLEEFGFNRRKGCQTVLKNEYNDTFKAIVALEKIQEEKLYKEKCSNLFSQKDLVNEPEPMYNGSIGVCLKDEEVNTITYNDANVIYKKMYGEDMPTLHVNGLKNNNLDYVIYEYKEDRDIFVELSFYGVGGTCSSNHIREIKSATQKDNTIKIVVYDYESNYMEIKNGIYHFDTDYFATNIPCTNKNQCIDIIKTLYLEYLDEYEITFEVKNNQYIFKNVKKVIK